MVAAMLLVLSLLSAGRAGAAELEAEARALEAALMAPCCYSQQVSVHQSDAAGQIKRDVRERLARGQTRQQIIDSYVAQYGKRILAEPPAVGFDATLYVLPVVLFFVSLFGVAVMVRRFASPRARPAVTVDRDTDAVAGASGASVERRITDELRDLD